MSEQITTEPFVDGVYFQLSEVEYHADAALGSTDLKKLAVEPANYWFGSALNPEKPIEEEEDKAHLTVGRAVHKFVLEGPQAFHALYDRYPVSDDLLTTSDQLLAWIKETGERFAVPVKPGSTKAARIETIRSLCEAHDLPTPRILDVIIQEATDAGRTLLKVDDFDRIVQAGGAVLDNPHLAASFGGGIPEVSIFWTDESQGEPVRRKCRIDYLKPRATVDLKSTRPLDGTPFVASCRRALATWNYPTQAAAYLQGRARLPTLVAAGRVFGDHDAELLKRIVSAENFAFVFIFWASAGAPLTWGGIMSPGNPVLDVGEEYVRRALENYVAARRTHGTAAPWITPQPLEEIELDHLPRWWGAAY